MVYGALSILVITLFPEGVVGLVKRRIAALADLRSARRDAQAAVAPIETSNRADAPVDAAIFWSHPTEGRIEPEEGDAGTEAIVECRGIEFSYGSGLKVLRNVDLAVKRGHIHGLIGPNGSGKSTLANVIAGRLRPIAGTILVKGVRVDGVAPSQRAALGMRRTFQAAELVRELTSSQNVGVGLFERVPRIVERAAFWPLLASARRDSAWIRNRAKNALGLVGAGDWAARLVGDVPHGVEQLTQLASVCVAGPDIIILDEPATGLSAKEVDHLARILSHLKTQGVTMIIIEHQTKFLFPLCDRVTVLNAGEVILTGSADEVRAHPVVRQVYLGE
jgi:branched-chain amino acid transport system permease protein